MLVGAQAVLGRLVGEQRVEDEGASAKPGLERRGDALGDSAPRLAVGVLEDRQRLHQLHRLVGVGQLDRDC